jgi:hypothetical protein
MKRGTLIGIVFFSSLLLPAWAVKSASQQSRMTWVGAILFLGFISTIATLALNASGKNPDTQGPYVRRYRPPFLAAVSFSFLTAELLAIAITYSEPGVGIVGGLGVFLSKIGAALFPVVAKYATAIEPPLSPDALFRAQAIVSIFLLAGIPSSIAFAAYYLRMPESERLNLHAANPRKRPSDGVVILLSVFAPLMAATVFFGWFEFDDEPVTKAKECIMKAVCYTRGGDLLVIAAAFMKAVVFFAFPLGALMVADANRVLPRT